MYSENGMAQHWTPSRWGRKLTGSPDWQLSLQGSELILTVDGIIYKINIENPRAWRIRKGFLWARVTLRPAASVEIKVDGLPNAQVSTLVLMLEQALGEKQTTGELAAIHHTMARINDWLEEISRQEMLVESQRRWLTQEIQDELERRKPAVEVDTLARLLRKPAVISALGDTLQTIEATLMLWQMDHRAAWRQRNARHTARELIANKSLFDTVERQPLTPEQAKAVVCFDNKVQVIASAGSGKTSTMVARAAYSISRDIVRPERIVMLAFNKQAAEELNQRCRDAFQRAGLHGVEVETSTFHALGLSIIGKATGSKPDIPGWAIDTGAGLRKLGSLVEQLKADSVGFALQWHLFRFVFGQDLPPFGSTVSATSWDAQGRGLVLTIDGKLVRSQEEAAICNWLFLNGVNYQYEARYKVDTADDAHRQYLPDFYYPDIDVYHEHFALNEQGQPPKHFTGYLDGVKWKRQLHEAQGTTLIETTSAQIRSGVAFQHLADQLTERGIHLTPLPDREIPENGQTPLKAEELVGLIRIFISHAKSNSLSIESIRQRISRRHDRTFQYRHTLFLNIVEPLLNAWDAALAAEGGIDFEDMINLAAQCLEAGNYIPPYELVMADEFQDASRARARLCRALVKKPGRYLFTVGDDWQSINRFAGADLSVMTAFRDWFGPSEYLRLEQTFRCPQVLCDISSQFVSKNPHQLSKQVRSMTPQQGAVIEAFQVDQKEKLADAIDTFIMSLANDTAAGVIPPGRNGRISVYILGRYNADRQYLPGREHRYNTWLDVSFLTIHRAKGSEADYVILPEMLTQLKGRSFPSTRGDDPLLKLAMPEGDNFPDSEERRLFYVALTRARRRVTLFTVKGKHSRFLHELCDDGVVSITDIHGQAIAEERCPACGQGVIVQRSGPYGEFRSCSNYPLCKYKPRKQAPALVFSTPSRPSD